MWRLIEVILVRVAEGKSEASCLANQTWKEGIKRKQTPVKLQHNGHPTGTKPGCVGGVCFSREGAEQIKGKPGSGTSMHLIILQSRTNSFL